MELFTADEIRQEVLERAKEYSDEDKSEFITRFTHDMAEMDKMTRKMIMYLRRYSENKSEKDQKIIGKLWNQYLTTFNGMIKGEKELIIFVEFLIQAGVDIDLAGDFNPITL